MLPPILHTEIEYELDSVLSPEEVIQRLKAPTLGLKLHRYDGETMPFDYYGQKFHLQGMLQRWHGTESHIDFRAKLNIDDTQQSTLDYVRSAIIIVIALITFFTLPDALTRIIENSYCFDSYASDNPCDITVLQIFTPLLMILLAWGIGGAIAVYLKRYAGMQRWQAQQAMGAKIEEIITVIK